MARKSNLHLSRVISGVEPRQYEPRMLPLATLREEWLLASRSSGVVSKNVRAFRMREHHEHIENLEADCGNREKIDRHQGLEVIVEEGTPSLRGGLANTDHILGDARLTDVDAEFQQFPVKTRRTPERILAAHGADELAKVLRDIGST